MMKKNFQQPDKCKICRKPLSAENMRVGYCDECAGKELEKIKKRVRVSSIIGAALIALVVIAFWYVSSTYYVSDMRGYEGDIFVPTFFGNLAFNARSFYRIINLSISMRILIVFFFFCVPFSSFVHLDYKTYRREAEQNLYKIDSYSGNMAAGTNSQRLDDVGLFIVSLVLTAISGPYFFIYRLYKLRRLTNFTQSNA